MPAGVVILPEDPADEWNLSEWLELAGNQKPGGPGAYSLQTSEDTLTIEIQDNQRRSAIQQILGYAYADDAAPYRLNRPAVAIQHPYLPWLWADSVSVQPIAPMGVLQDDLTRKAKTPGVGVPTYSPAYTTRYSRSELLVRFKPIYWRPFREDDPSWDGVYTEAGKSSKEWMRYFGVVNKSVELDLITAEGANDDAQLYWAEGVVGGTGSGPTSPGTPFNGTQYIRVNRTTFKMVWKNVPLNYTCGEIDFNADDIASFLMPRPTRLTRALGTVNKTAFPGANSPYKAGTLLLKAIEETPYQQPVRTDSEFGYFAADYSLTFEYMDPPRDPSSVQNLGGGGATAVKYGHHLYPYRPTRYWYLATAGTSSTRGTYTGKTQLEETEFHDLFRSASDTTNFPLPT